MKLATVGEMKLSNKFFQLEEEDNSEAKKKERETTPQRPNDRTVETARTETPQQRMKGEIKDRHFHTRGKKDPTTPMVSMGRGVHGSRQVPWWFGTWEEQCGAKKQRDALFFHE